MVLTFLVSYTGVSVDGRGWIWHQDRPQVGAIRWGRTETVGEGERERAVAPYGVGEEKKWTC